MSVSRASIIKAIARKREIEEAQGANADDEVPEAPGSDPTDQADEETGGTRRSTRNRASTRVKRNLPAADEEAGNEGEGEGEEEKASESKSPKKKRAVPKKPRADPSHKDRIYREDIDLSHDIILSSTWGGEKGVYTEVLAEWWQRYEEAAHAQKRQVCDEVIKEMFKRGARFLVKVEDGSGEDYYLTEPEESDRVSKRILRALRKEVVDQTKHLTNEEREARSRMLIEKRKQEKLKSDPKHAEKLAKLPEGDDAEGSESLKPPAQSTHKYPTKIPRGTVFTKTPEGTIVVTTAYGTIEVGGKDNVIKTYPNPTQAMGPEDSTMAAAAAAAEASIAAASVAASGSPEKIEPQGETVAL